MDYKVLFNKILVLLSSPAKAWDEIASKGIDKTMTFNFVYPLIGFCALTEFIGTFFGKEYSADLFQLALTRSCAMAISLFGGFFLGASLLDKISRRFFQCSTTMDEMQCFVGYSMVVILVLNVISGIFPIAILFWILQLYTLFVVFEGARRFVHVDERNLTTYTIVASLVILLSPAVIEFLFNKLSVVLN